MKKSRVLAMMLVVVMVVATMSTAVFAVEPPANAKVRVTEKTVTATFSEDQPKVWDIWDTEGNFGTYSTTGDALNITGGAVPFVTLSGFGSNLENVNEIVVEYKATSALSIQLRIREKGYSEKVTLDPTGGEYVKASILPSQFEGGSLTAEDIKGFKSFYDSEAGKYTSTAMLYIDSQDASIKSLNAYWYSWSSESNQVRKEESITFGEKTWGSWGSWTGGGTTAVPLSMQWTEGANEDGTSKALVVRGGNTGSGSYAGGQFMISGLDLTAVDAVKFRYKSTANINAYFNRAYQVEPNETVPPAEFEIIKGFDFDNKNTTDVVETYTSVFDESGKNISGKQWKKESKSSGAQLKSTGGKWDTAIIPISKFGTQEFLAHMKTNIVNKSFIPCYHVRFEGCCYGDFATTGKEFVWGGFSAVWYEKLPTMSALEFEANGGVAEFLDIGTTDVKVELKNDSNVNIEDSVLVVALYEGSKLIDMDVKLVDTPAMSTSDVQTLSVDLDADEVLDEHQIRVMLWDSAASMNQITNLALFDAYGYMTAE